MYNALLEEHIDYKFSHGKTMVVILDDKVDIFYLRYEMRLKQIMQRSALFLVNSSSTCHMFDFHIKHTVAQNR